MFLKREIPCFVAFALLVAPLTMSTAFAAASVATQDIEYSRPGGVPLYMDAAIPDGPGPFPAVVIVHGGGWVRGNRRVDVAPLFEPLEKARIAWFSIDYQLATDIVHFGSAIEDVRNAVGFIKAHAVEYRVDSDRIALIGESAGGQLAAMAALEPRQNSNVRAVVAMYAPTDLVALASTSELVPQQIRNALHGTPFESLLLARLSQLSPIDNIKPESPPFLLIHGTADRLVPFSQSSAMCDRMKQAGESCELYPVDGGGHGMRWWESLVPREAKGYKDVIVRWLKIQLMA